MTTRRLNEHLDEAVTLPFIDEVDEKRLKRCIVGVVMHAMATDLKLSEVAQFEVIMLFFLQNDHLLLIWPLVRLTRLPGPSS